MNERQRLTYPRVFGDPLNWMGQDFEAVVVVSRYRSLLRTSPVRWCRGVLLG